MSTCKAIQTNAPVGCINCGNCKRDNNLVKYKGKYVDQDALDTARDAEIEAIEEHSKEEE